MTITTAAERDCGLELHYLAVEESARKTFLCQNGLDHVFAVLEREGRIAMKSDRLMIWRFADAPKTLRALHHEVEMPEWVVLIPRALNGPDLDEAILKGAKLGQVARYETLDGDTVYIGISQLDGLTQGLAALARPAAMAATHSRRK
jgi:hypothetical protein